MRNCDRRSYSRVFDSPENADAPMPYSIKHSTRCLDPLYCIKVLALFTVVSVLVIVISTATLNADDGAGGYTISGMKRNIFDKVIGGAYFRMQNDNNVHAFNSANSPPVVSVEPVQTDFVGIPSTSQQQPPALSFNECWRLPDDEKFDCCADTKCTPDSCVARQCCWNPAEPSAAEHAWPDFSDVPYSKDAEQQIATTMDKYFKTVMWQDEAPRPSKSEANHLLIQHFTHMPNKTLTNKKTADTPWCYFPPDAKGYALRWLNETKFGFRGLLELTSTTDRHNGTELKQLMLDVFIETDYRVHLRIADVDGNRFVAPYPELNNGSSRENVAKSPRYRVVVRQHQPFSFAIERADTREVIFDTKVAAPLIFADQYIELSARLSTNYVYGLGEHVDRIKHTFEWDRFIMWNSDGWPLEMLPLYGTQPFYLAVESSGHAHGVYFHNLNAMDVILRPEQSITWRTIGGVIDLYFFMGPSPSDVVAQYTELVGRPFMPPYWSLGFHLCRYGYGSLDRTRYINSINRNAGIPIEVQWNDIDYMDKWKDFTYNKEHFAGLPQFIDELHRDELKYMIITDPGISAAEKPGSYTPYDMGRDADVFVKNDTDDILIGLVWTGNWTVWPDFTHPKAEAYWTRVIGDFHANIEFDGLWIDMNEPSNFGIGSKDSCPWSSKYERPPYMPPIRFPALAAKTLCMTAKQYKGIHYNLHNAYGLTESMATFSALNSTFNGRARPFVISRSNFAGSGKFSGSWNGDAGASWHDLRASIPYMLNFNMFGIPMAGADICGFHSNTTVELCARWSQLGAFYTFSRNHNDLEGSDQDPASMGPIVVAAARQALQMRYQLLPHFYTMFYEAHMFGATVARPLFFEFPRDPVAKICDWQFLIGSSLLVVPVLEANVSTVTAYLPPDDVWYDLYTGARLYGGDASGYVQLDAPMDKINLIQRGGSVLVQQKYSNSTAVMRRNPFMLSLALGANESVQLSSTGKLFWDAGDGYEAFGDEQKFNLIEFYADHSRLVTKVKRAGFAVDNGMRVESIRVSGLRYKPKRVMLNDDEIDFDWNTDTNVMQLATIDRVDLLRPLVLSYKQ